MNAAQVTHTPEYNHAFMDFAASESAALAETTWDRWIRAATRAVGHDLDGDQVVDGYSLDGAYDAFRAGGTVKTYISSIPVGKARKGYQAALLARAAIASATGAQS